MISVIIQDFQTYTPLYFKPKEQKFKDFLSQEIPTVIITIVNYPNLHGSTGIIMLTTMVAQVHIYVGLVHTQWIQIVQVSCR